MAKAFKRANRLTLNLDEGGRLIAVDLLKILKSKYNYRKLSTCLLYTSDAADE